MTRPDCPPGTIIEHRQRFVVTAQRRSEVSGKHPGKLRYRELGPVERVVVGGRWKVIRRYGRSYAIHPDRIHVFVSASHAAAIAYADRMARGGQP